MQTSIENEFPINEEKEDNVYEFGFPPLSLLWENEEVDQDEKYCQVVKEKIESIICNSTVINYYISARVIRYVVEVNDEEKPKLREYASLIKKEICCDKEIIIYNNVGKVKNVLIDIPRKNSKIINLKEMIANKEFLKSKDKDLFVLGKSILNKNVYARLEDLPSILVTGSTGSGKSVFLNSVLVSLMYHSTPNDIKFLLIDPKYIEFTSYLDLPYMLVREPISDIEESFKVFKYAIEEMKDRKKYINKYGCNRYEDYNNLQKTSNERLKLLPRILIVVDELAELMYSNNKKELEDYIIQLAQKGKEVGIYMILATQRPIDQVITKDIKDNFVAKISFRLFSSTDSKVILDRTGAECLLGNGDMFIKTKYQNAIQRLQSPLVQECLEVGRITNYIKENNDCYFDEKIRDKIIDPNKHNNNNLLKKNFWDIDLLADVLKYCITENMVSKFKLQKIFSLTYLRVTNLIEYMTEIGYISQEQDSKEMKILMTKEEYNKEFGDKYGKIL